MESPPYEKQGEPVDADWGIKGYWVIGDYLFLFLPPPTDKHITRKASSGTNCFGFNAEGLATQFGIRTDDLLLNNHIKSLLVRWEDGVPTRGAKRCIHFVFELPFGQRVAADVLIFDIVGRA